MCREARRPTQGRLCTIYNEYFLGEIGCCGREGGLAAPPLPNYFQADVSSNLAKTTFICSLNSSMLKRLVTRSGCQTVSDVDHFLVNSYKKQIRESNSSFGEHIITASAKYCKFFVSLVLTANCAVDSPIYCILESLLFLAANAAVRQSILL